MNDKENLKHLEEKQRQLSKRIHNIYLRQELEEYKSHEKYIGKCYKHKSENKYYKVLSNYSSNTCRLTCLKFNLDENIYDYYFKNENMFRSENPNIDLDICLFEIDDVFVFGNSVFFDKTIEISQEEFDQAQQKMIDKFIKETKEVTNNINKMIEDYKRYHLKEEQ